MACAHHWTIEQVPGPTGPGICRHCGVERDFPNSIDAPEFGQSWRTLNVSRRPSRRRTHASLSRLSDDQ